MNVEDEIYKLNNLVYGLLEKVSILEKEKNELIQELMNTKDQFTREMNSTRTVVKIHASRFKDLEKVIKMGQKVSDLEKDFEND